jgi:hypothetical protein
MLALKLARAAMRIIMIAIQNQFMPKRPYRIVQQIKRDVSPAMALALSMLKKAVEKELPFFPLERKWMQRKNPQNVSAVTRHRRHWPSGI